MGCWDCFLGILYYYPLMMCMRFTVLGVVLGGLLLGVGCNNGNGGGENDEKEYYTLLPDGVSYGDLSIVGTDLIANFKLENACGNGRPSWQALLSGELQVIQQGSWKSYRVEGRVERSANSSPKSLKLNVETGDIGPCKLEVNEMELKFTAANEDAGVRDGVVESVERAFLWEEEKEIEEWGNPVVNVTYKARPKSLEENLKKARVHVTFKRQGSGE